MQLNVKLFHLAHKTYKPLICAQKICARKGGHLTTVAYKFGWLRRSDLN